MADPVLLPDEYYREIGKVAVHWTALETLINKALIRLLGKSFYEGSAHIVFAHMSFPQKMDVLSALAKEQLALDPEHPVRNYATEVQPLLREAAKRRNKIIHSFYTRRDGMVFAASLTARGKLETVEFPITLTELALGVHSLHEAGYALKAIVDAFPDVLLSLSDQ